MASGLAESASALRLRMAQLSNTSEDDWYLVSKARQGMQIVLRASGQATHRSEVLTQLFTCVTAIDPILTAGLGPRYVDIDPNTLSVDPSLARMDERTCAVVLQNTFGITNVESATALREAAHAVGALVLEDSAHCVGRLATDAGQNPAADVSVHSFGVEKMLAGTYFGGAVWVNPAMENKVVEQTVREALAALPPMEATFERATRKYRNQMRMITRLPHAAGQALRAKWERKGTLEPAVSEQERRGETNHEPSVPSPWVCEQALAALDGLQDNEANRRSCVRAYLEELGESAARDLRVPAAIRLTHAQPLLRFPVFVNGQSKADAAIAAIASLGFYAPAWPRPLLVPGMLDASAYGLAQGFEDWPVSQRLSSDIVCLPTDIDPSRVHEVVQAIRNL